MCGLRELFLHQVATNRRCSADVESRTLDALGRLEWAMGSSGCAIYARSAVWLKMVNTGVSVSFDCVQRLAR